MQRIYRYSRTKPLREETGLSLDELLEMPVEDVEEMIAAMEEVSAYRSEQSAK